MDTIIGEILACLRAWEPSARVLGNVRAQDAIEAIERLVDELAEVQEKALRFDLDSAGIERREQEATELVTLRAELAECKRDAERYRWLREKIENDDFLIARVSDWGLTSWCGDDPDRYIDAALAAKGGE